MASQQRRVLIVDDERDLREDLSAMLVEAGIFVVEAANGRQALQYLTSTEQLPDLVVTNLSMPEMGGWELVRLLKSYVRLSQLPVLVVSGYEPPKDPTRMAHLSEYLRKPVAAERFLAAVHRGLHLVPNPA